jgi:signal transduction histidine kinase
MVNQLVERLERDARFASDVSHELRSPLTTLATSVAVMRQSRTDLEPEAFAALELLGADVETFQTLVEDLLDMTRNEAGGIYLENVELVELVHQCVRSASRRLGLEETNLSFDPTTTNSSITVDRRRFERIIANLLENARRYGGGATSLSVSADGHCAIIDVDDAGPGVPLEERERIFDRFYRGVEASNRTEVHGTGLGLSLVADHVARFHGTVAVLDSPDGGARFRVTIPLSEESPE